MFCCLTLPVCGCAGEQRAGAVAVQRGVLAGALPGERAHPRTVGDAGGARRDRGGGLHRRVLVREQTQEILVAHDAASGPSQALAARRRASACGRVSLQVSCSE